MVGVLLRSKRLIEGEIRMKMVLISSVIAIIIAVVAYFVLVNTGMDTATVNSGPDVRL